jgi:ketosteroid isomerase-like protein
MTPSSSSTEANVQAVRTGIDAFNRGDINAMTALGGDDFEYDWSSTTSGSNRRSSSLAATTSSSQPPFTRAAAKAYP